ncbi:hypothetical protein IFM89_009292 [Coptis chinensis]|uniref:Uncharacterized protein n=1 Tax=Coptis chinensis TaxID=261450 RepID=A0A835IL09_9MAGN|nr:hypothetical protein IFM89_009292 [Coptis chinensis]
MKMEASHGVVRYIAYFLFFIPVFILLFVLGFVKAAIFSPFVFLVIAFGDTGVIIGLWPLHLFWTAYCISKYHLFMFPLLFELFVFASYHFIELLTTVLNDGCFIYLIFDRSKKFGPFLKTLLILTLPIPIALWTVVGLVGTVIMGIGYAFVWPVMETFRAISKPGVRNKLLGCLADGTWSNVWACTIVRRDFGDFSFHSYFSVMDELLEAKEDEKSIELKISQVPGCIVAAVLGVVLDIPLITLIVIYKAPIMLFKGWHRLVEDLVGRSGPFLETVCVPFAGLLIVLWPFAVVLAVLVGIMSSLGFGCYAAVVAYQVLFDLMTLEGLLFSLFLLSGRLGRKFYKERTTLCYRLVYHYLMSTPTISSTYEKGPAFEVSRPTFKDTLDDDDSQLLPRKGLHEQLEALHAKQILMAGPSEKIKAVKAVVIWDNFFKGCELSGEELIREAAIGIRDLEAWQRAKNKIVNIGIPAYTFVQCFLRSIRSGSIGFLMYEELLAATFIFIFSEGKYGECCM